jgi:uncharacterized protein (TIGR02265 family)
LDPEFTAADFSAPLDCRARIASAPEDGWVRGMFFQEIAVRASARLGRTVGRERYVAFKAYPLREYLHLLVEAAGVLHPDETVREGLRRLGHLAYPTFAASTVGGILFSVAGDFVGALRLASQAFRVAVHPGKVEIRRIEEGVAIAELRSMYSFAEAYQVGVFEGAMQAFGVTGDVRLRIRSISEVDLRLTWR